jgi:hypothetical protein
MLKQGNPKEMRNKFPKSGKSQVVENNNPSLNHIKL